MRFMAFDAKALAAREMRFMVVDRVEHYEPAVQPEGQFGRAVAFQAQLIALLPVVGAGYATPCRCWDERCRKTCLEWLVGWMAIATGDPR